MSSVFRGLPLLGLAVAFMLAPTACKKGDNGSDGRAESDSDTGSNSDLDNDTNIDASIDADTETDTETDSENSDTENDTSGDTDIDTDTDTETESDSSTESDNSCEDSDCDDSNPCTEDACDATGECAHTNLADGEPCLDGDACTQNESCNEGFCVPAEEYECNLRVVKRNGKPPFSTEASIEDVPENATVRWQVGGEDAGTGLSVPVDVTENGALVVVATVETDDELRELGTKVWGAVANELVRMEVGPEGATISLVSDSESNYDGAELIIPEGALDAPVEIKVLEWKDLELEGLPSNANVLELLPHGIEFNIPAQLWTPISATEEQLACSEVRDHIFGFYADNQSEILYVSEVDCIERKARIDIPHFSDFSDFQTANVIDRLHWVADQTCDRKKLFPEYVADACEIWGYYASARRHAEKVKHWIKVTKSIAEIYQDFNELKKDPKQELELVDIDAIQTDQVNIEWALTQPYLIKEYYDQTVNSGIDLDTALDQAYTAYKLNRILNRHGGVIDDETVSEALAFSKYQLKDSIRWKYVEKISSFILNNAQNAAKKGVAPGWFLIAVPYVKAQVGGILFALQLWNRLATARHLEHYFKGRQRGIISWNETNGRPLSDHTDKSQEEEDLRFYIENCPHDDLKEECKGWFYKTERPGSMKPAFSSGEKWRLFEALYKAYSRDRKKLQQDVADILNQIATHAEEDYRRTADGWSWNVELAHSWSVNRVKSSKRYVNTSVTMEAGRLLSIDMSESVGTPDYIVTQYGAKLDATSTGNYTIYSEKYVGRQDMLTIADILPPGKVLHPGEHWIGLRVIVDGVAYQLDINVTAEEWSKPTLSLIEPAEGDLIYANSPFTIALAGADPDGGEVKLISYDIDNSTGNYASKNWIERSFDSQGILRFITNGFPADSYDLFFEIRDDEYVTAEVSGHFEVVECEEDTCMNCLNLCQSATSRCSDGHLRSCVEDQDGCWIWSEWNKCTDGVGFCESDSACGTCYNQCSTENLLNCSSGSFQTCVQNELGCLIWSESFDCQSGVCDGDGASCSGCNNVCSAGAMECDLGDARSCVANDIGCRVWTDWHECPESWCADSVSCGECDHECDPVGTSCNADGVNLEICSANENGCRLLVVSNCENGCSEGACLTADTDTDTNTDIGSDADTDVDTDSDSDTDTDTDTETSSDTDTSETCGVDSCTYAGYCDDSSGVIVCSCLTGYQGDYCESCEEGYLHVSVGVCEEIPPGCEGELTFADPNLEQVVREAAGVPTGPMTIEDVLGINTLEANAMDIESLEGIECVLNLSGIVFNHGDPGDSADGGVNGDGGVSDVGLDLSFLESLPNLEVIELDGKCVKNISVFQNLPNLRRAVLPNNQVQDLAALVELKSLEYLDLRNNRISDLTPLASLDDLKTLLLDQNLIVNLSPLSGLTLLTNLSLKENLFEDISPLLSNTGFDTGDQIHLEGNDNMCAMEQAYLDMDALRSRGPTVTEDCDCSYTDTCTDPDTDTGTGSDADTETSQDTDTDGETDTETGSGSDTDTGSETDADAGTDIDAGMEADSGTDADVGSDTDVDAGTGSDTDTGSDTSADTDSATESDTDSESESESETDTDTESDTDSETETDTDTESDTDSETETDTDTESDTDTGSETDTDTDTSEPTQWHFTDSGQYKCYDSTSEMTCPADGEPFFGQDAQYGSNALVLQSQGSGSIIHESTRIVWQSGKSDTTLTQAEAETYCNDLSQGGTDDWHLPTLMELMTIIDYSRSSPVVDETYFPGDGTDQFWTSSAYAGAANNAWYLDFSDGTSQYSDTGELKYVRCLVGTPEWCTPTCGTRTCGSDGCGGDCGHCDLGAVCSPDGQCVEASVGTSLLTSTGQNDCYNTSTQIDCPLKGEAFWGQDSQYISISTNFTSTELWVTENATGLTWQRHVGDYELDHASAASYCESLMLDGYDDWRLPSRAELISIVDYSKYRPTLDEGVFPETGDFKFWTDVEYAGDASRAFYVDFNDGTSLFALKTDLNAVRCVRDTANSCVSTCGDRQCGRDGCGGDCGYCSADETCSWDGYCTPGVVGSSLLTDTGQSVCYDNGNAIDCPAEGESHYGQDAQYQGNPLNYAVEEQFVIENATGLTWQRHVGNYGLDQPTAIAYCDSLVLDTYDDWRLPSRTELISIVDYSLYWPSLDDHDFPRTANFEYWTTIDYAGDTNRAWYVDFNDGTSASALKTDLRAVRCVRDTGNSCIPSCTDRNCGSDGCGGDCGYCQAGETCSWDGICTPGVTGTSLLTDTGQDGCYNNGAAIDCPASGESYYGQDSQYQGTPFNYAVDEQTVFENATGLTWQRDVGDYASDQTTAVAYCDSLTLDSYDDWRLPSRAELISIVDYSKYWPCLDDHVFPRTADFDFWSAVAYSADSDKAWYVDFNDGSSYVANKTELKAVRCVR